MHKVCEAGRKREDIMEFQNLITLINAVSESRLTELKYEEDGVKIKLSKQKGKVAAFTEKANVQVENVSEGIKEHTAESTAEAGTKKTDGKEVTSPLVGTFYAAPAEDAPAFVKVGDTVKKGQTLAIVEAMKLMNEIESDYDGTIAEIYVENGAPVEFGQPLFRIV